MDTLARPQVGTRWGLVDSRPARGAVFAVCAHGRHDQCCAVRGRAVAALLGEAYPDETWEGAHLGSDRFAGTMVLLPHGLYYGWVDGRSAYSHPVQAAQHFARAELGDDRLDAYRRCTRRAPRTAGRSGSTAPCSRPAQRQARVRTVSG